MTTSLRQNILDRFKKVYASDSGRWVVKEDVCKFGQRLGYSSENCGRRLREMESGTLSSGKTCTKELEVRYEHGTRGQILAFYRYKPSPQVDMAREIARFETL